MFTKKRPSVEVEAEDVIAPANGKYACLQMSKRDRVRFVEFPKDVYCGAEKVLRESWPPGIKSEGVYGGAFEYIMKGSPWGTLGTAEIMGSRALMRSLLAFLYGRGWVLAASINPTEKIYSKDSLLFKKAAVGDAAASPPAADFLAIHLSHHRFIYLHGAGDALLNDLRAALRDIGFYHSDHNQHDVPGFMLRDGPWWCHGTKTVKVRRLLLRLLELAERHGWESYGTILQRTGSDKVRGLDTWYFIKRN
ncbi:hypothetical protein BX600DRAFT_509224 [Xylariales sp. PMI_506]|nr:hypothetical protein BX600DRAFT_509224 [Xylariales sp. PMI_506]